MGAGAGTLAAMEASESLTLDEARKLAGEKFDEAAFEAAATDGKVTLAAATEWAASVGADMGQEGPTSTAAPLELGTKIVVDGRPGMFLSHNDDGTCVVEFDEGDGDEECVARSKVEVRGAETTTEATTEAPAKATAEATAEATTAEATAEATAEQATAEATAEQATAEAATTPALEAAAPGPSASQADDDSRATLAVDMSAAVQELTERRAQLQQHHDGFLERDDYALAGDAMQEIGQVEELIRSAERLAAASTTSKKDNPVQRKAIDKLNAYRQGLAAKAKAEEEAAAVVLDAAAEEDEECVARSKVEVRGAETTAEATTEAPAKVTARRGDVAPAAVSAIPSSAEGTSKPQRKVKQAAQIHKGCFDYVKSMNNHTPDIVISVVCCTAMLASGKKVTKLADAQRFCKNKNAALKACQDFDAASAAPKLLKEARKLYGPAHEDMALIEKKSRVVAEMAKWNKDSIAQ